MIVVEKASELRNLLDLMTSDSSGIGFVPTMGALHIGHKSLIMKAKLENALVVTSIFVNPTQFNDKNDLLNYPRTPESDEKLLDEAGCDLLFRPTEREVYPDDQLLDIDFGPLERVMEGSYRPGHFRGVATVVYRLFKMVSPGKAYFGEKDFQQLAIIREMNRRMKTGVEIIGCPTLREEDGLAFSSRNIHLSLDERSGAGVIFSTLKWAAEALKSMDIKHAREKSIERIEAVANFKVQYLEFVEGDTLQPITSWKENARQRVCIAVITSRTRLIDNMAI